MSIKLAILLATDARIGHYRRHPAELKGLLNNLIPAFSDELCFLSSYWRALHQFLTSPLWGC